MNSCAISRIWWRSRSSRAASPLPRFTKEARFARPVRGGLPAPS
jgi:hypothetical protein